MNSDSYTRTKSLHEWNFLKKVSSSKCLGIEIDEFLTWDTHNKCL